ncbi:FeoA family protein [Mahella sp.]|uniref:FeoA family protein n=1 Tax=Mahella sp. TaxID=2798721 RepID=UPI0025B9E71C|nr:FeoA family protein [Mahella sp.]MBZ4666721.1 hypothetical protein [Mahella sp.]MDK2902997.1 ferrous iron transport protein [Clostridiales bacterium]
MKTVHTKKLSELPKGARGRVIRIDAKGNSRRRMLEMGLVPNTEVSVEGMAPMGDPIEVSIKGYRLSLRKEEAAQVVVEVPEIER